MKKYLIIGGVVLILLGLITIQSSSIKKLKTERDKYQHNTESLLSEIEHYKTEDSLNAVKVGVLQLKVSEFEKYRAEDAALIKTLQVKNRDLQSVTTAQLETINELKGKFKDSTVYVPVPGEDRVDTVVLRCIDIVDPWFELHGCADSTGDFTGKHINREALLITSTVKYKRFLGFLWKTRKIKNRQVDAVSKNPATDIIELEFIEVEE
jgi:hypothetical protein